MDIGPVEVVTSTQRRRRWTAEEKRAMVEEAEQPGMSVSAVARKVRGTPQPAVYVAEADAQGGALSGQGRRERGSFLLDRNGVQV
jgi:transposase